MSALLHTGLSGLSLVARGKVRDIYAAGDDALLFIATDRISAFDHVLGSLVPGKGIVLTQLSLFWFKLLAAIVPNHLLASDAQAFDLPLTGEERAWLDGRAMLVRKAQMFPVECVVRGYLSGSGWKEYQATGKVCGIELPGGLQESDKLPEPIFTPATKSELGGHDENIPFSRMEEILGVEDALTLRELSFAIYNRASAHAEGCGLILADTKFEFGRVNGQIILADEVLTPDSSRYWPLDSYKPGGAQSSFDKQFVRDYLEDCGWNKQAPAPALPPSVVQHTQHKYLEAYRLLTGNTLHLDATAPEPVEKGDHPVPSL